MGKIEKEKSWLGLIDIEAIELDAKSRDDIPAILFGLQAIYKNKETRTELFRLLDERILPDRRGAAGRQAHLWRILVMGVLKRGLGCDFDHLQELVNNHANVQAFLGHDSRFDPCRYELQTIRSNVTRWTPDLLRKASELVSATGHKVARKMAWRNIGRAQ